MTQPLTPSDCDLRDFKFMPIDVVRLRDSGISATSTGDEFRCAVLLWCASWHQVPAASIPDDDVILAQLAGYGRVVREWQSVREGALRGWIKCDDGRLYHPVVAEKANEAWAMRLKYRDRKETERIRLAEKRANEKTAKVAATTGNGCSNNQALLLQQQNDVGATNFNTEPTSNNAGATNSNVDATDLSLQQPDQNKRGSRLPVDWALPKSWGEWALSERQDLQAADVRKISEAFRDHWLANANQPSSKKADWQAAWRNWVRKQPQPIRGSATKATSDFVQRDYGKRGAL